jgi:hypothetical protein
LQQTQQAAQQLSRTKVTTIFDKEGLVTGKKIEETFKQIQSAAAGAAGGMNDFQKALSRVIVVAPIWMAFRATIQLVTSTINDGFRTWMEFDQQLIKSKAVIHDFSGSTETAMGQLEDTIRKFSTESGISLKELASSFYRFGTVGIAFADSLSGAIASAKLAKATLGDTDTIARSLAMTYRLLGDTIDSSLSPMEKQESLAGKIYHLWKTNAFEATEYAGSLNNFISTANIANFTTDQTIALLASLGTAGVQGARGGTLLKTAIQKLVDNLDLLELIAVKKKYYINFLSPKVIGGTWDYMRKFSDNTLAFANNIEIFCLLFSYQDFNKFISINDIENTHTWGTDLLLGYYNIRSAIFYKSVVNHMLPSNTEGGIAGHQMHVYLNKRGFKSVAEVNARYKPIYKTIQI